jgi:predicted nucleotidyltransferase/HEPN domain-containing protein
MKKTLRHLPKNKRKELKLISKRIQEATGVEKIILFGSYARGDWVEEPGQAGYFKYQSDFDLLVVVNDKKLAKQLGRWDKIEEKLENNDYIKTPVCLITHSIQYVNQMLSEGQYFFSDIAKEGVLLFDTGNFELAEKNKNRSPEEYRKQAETHFKKWYNSANDFYESSNTNLSKGKINLSVFELHQAVERYYCTILLVFTNYKPKSHDIEKLGKMAAAHEQKLLTVFPRGAPRERRMFKLLKKAYVDARYNEDYEITKKELQWLGKRVSRLQKLTESLCVKKIRSFTGK